VPTTIESMTGIYIKSDFFNTAPTFELFPPHHRAALLYGKNGCGKTTVAQGFREYVQPVIPPIVELSLKANGVTIPAPTGQSGKFFVFDEEYVAKRVRVKEDGLDAIVLFGEQIDLETQITETEGKITAKQTEVDHQESECAKYTIATNVNAPDYWLNQIRIELKKDTGWAGKGSRIKGQRQNLSVTDDVIDRIGQLTPARPQAELQEEFDRRYAQFTAVNSTAATLPTEALTIPVIGDKGQQAKDLLAEAIAQPQWTEREHRIMDILGGDGLETAKAFLSDTEKTICDKCLQPISKEYRAAVLHELDCLLNREVEEFKEKLRQLLIPEIANTAYQAYHDLPSYNSVRDRLDDYIQAVSNHNTAVKAKIDNPFDPLDYDDSIGFMAANKAVNQALTALEGERDLYNRSINKRSDVARELKIINDALAHYAIDNMYGSLKTQREARADADTLLLQKRNELQDLFDHKAQLNARRKNFKLAADAINDSLEYIFYCKGRLTLELGSDEQYHLKVNGHTVAPSKVSCGERNALALSYFFTEIASKANANEVYSNEVFLVIDDPVSSFDFENRIGVQSLLRWKLGQVLEGCATSKVLIMTHDINTAFDLEKGLQEIRDRLKGTPKTADFKLWRLEDYSVSRLTNDQRNELHPAACRIFEYAKTGTGEGLTIGNIMSRVLEAFATFSYKKGIDTISADDAVLRYFPYPKEILQELMTGRPAGEITP
jgi:energy-coupling factor transporter ATP-binding protein EcfA2